MSQLPDDQRMMLPIYTDQYDALRAVLAAGRELISLNFDNPHAIGRATLELSAAITRYDKTDTNPRNARTRRKA